MTATIFRKTVAGKQEVLRRRLDLSVALRGLLAMVDGRATVEALIRRAAALKFDQSSFDDLLRKGLIEPVVPYKSSADESALGRQAEVQPGAGPVVSDGRHKALQVDKKVSPVTRSSASTVLETKSIAGHSRLNEILDSGACSPQGGAPHDVGSMNALDAPARKTQRTNPTPPIGTRLGSPDSRLAGDMPVPELASPAERDGRRSEMPQETLDRRSQAIRSTQDHLLEPLMLQKATLAVENSRDAPEQVLYESNEFGMSVEIKGTVPSQRQDGDFSATADPPAMSLGVEQKGFNLLGGSFNPAPQPVARELTTPARSTDSGIEIIRLPLEAFPPGASQGRTDGLHLDNQLDVTRSSVASDAIKPGHLTGHLESRHCVDRAPASLGEKKPDETPPANSRPLRPSAVGLEVDTPPKVGSGSGLALDSGHPVTKGALRRKNIALKSPSVEHVKGSSTLLHMHGEPSRGSGENVAPPAKELVATALGSLETARDASVDASNVGATAGAGNASEAVESGGSFEVVRERPANEMSTKRVVASDQLEQDPKSTVRRPPSTGNVGDFEAAREYVEELLHKTWWRGKFLLRKVKKGQSLDDLRALREEIINLLVSSEGGLSREVVVNLDRVLFPTDS